MDKQENTNLYRRNLLKLLLVGGGGFLLGKFASPLVDLWNGDKVISEKDFQSFKFVETNRELRILDKDGSEMLILDKDSLRT